MSGRTMQSVNEIFAVLKTHGVPFVIVDGHAVNFHGFVRATQDYDVVWIRRDESEQQLLRALNELDARYIGDEIDPISGVERVYPVTPQWIQITHLMMLTTRLGFLDLFDYIPGFPNENVANLLSTSLESGGLRYASLSWLRKMKESSGRPQDLIDLKNLPPINS